MLEDFLRKIEENKTELGFTQSSMGNDI
jgi:hypothetical protein